MWCVLSFGAEDMTWVEPEEMGRGPGDSMMQDAIHRALVRPLDDRTWICGVCRTIVTKAHFKRHLERHDREGHSRSVVDEAWRAFQSEKP